MHACIRAYVQACGIQPALTGEGCVCVCMHVRMLLQAVLRQVYQHQHARLARFRGDPATWWAERSIDALRASAPVPRDTVQVRTEEGEGEGCVHTIVVVVVGTRTCSMQAHMPGGAVQHGPCGHASAPPSRHACGCMLAGV